MQFVSRQKRELLHMVPILWSIYIVRIVQIVYLLFYESKGDSVIFPEIFWTVFWSPMSAVVIFCADSWFRVAAKSKIKILRASRLFTRINLLVQGYIIGIGVPLNVYAAHLRDTGHPQEALRFTRGVVGSFAVGGLFIIPLLMTIAATRLLRQLEKGLELKRNVQTEEQLARDRVRIQRIRYIQWGIYAEAMLNGLIFLVYAAAFRQIVSTSHGPAIFTFFGTGVLALVGIPLLVLVRPPSHSQVYGEDSSQKSPGSTVHSEAAGHAKGGPEPGLLVQISRVLSFDDEPTASSRGRPRNSPQEGASPPPAQQPTPETAT
eukprot:TRINITY_DN3510_c0_g1_i5.p1 TRINITY_DN3510_c0_g1~~TRINITY_DN3510_c0_g1_i5.p1  ORF type:complete len:319 (+),score=39.51 TRINITY_DN3510_c0_g1_i5:116-1072(+)